MNTLNFQRRTLGILCALLVPLCLLFGLFGINTNLPLWYCSVSATYYANSRMWMIGLLFATSLFFFCYRGYGKSDIIMSWIQAIAAIGIVIFPCNTPGVPATVGMFNLPVATSHIIHCISTAILFLTFATNIIYNFPKGNKDNPQKKKRNLVYYICGITIYVFAAFQALTTFLPIPNWFPMTMINEFILLEAFAVAWLTKSEAFKKLNDC